MNCTYIATHGTVGEGGRERERESIYNTLATQAHVILDAHETYVHVHVPTNTCMHSTCMHVHVQYVYIHVPVEDSDNIKKELNSELGPADFEVATDDGRDELNVIDSDTEFRTTPNMEVEQQVLCELPVVLVVVF